MPRVSPAVIEIQPLRGCAAHFGLYFLFTFNRLAVVLFFSFSIFNFQFSIKKRWSPLEVELHPDNRFNPCGCVSVSIFFNCGFLLSQE